MKNERLWAEVVEKNDLLNLSTHKHPLLIKKENLLFFIQDEKTAMEVKENLNIKYITELPLQLKCRAYVVTFSPEYGYDMYKCHWNFRKLF